MNLSPQDVILFYKLTYALQCFINRKLTIVQGAETPEDVRQLTSEEKIQIRNALWKNADLIDSFVKENPHNLTHEELDIVGSWRHRVKGRFILVSHLKKHSVFLKEDEETAFGVLALSEPFEASLGSRLPIYLEGVLLPFKGKITYDGMIAPFNISFGRGYRQSFMELYQQAKAKHGIITSLPFSVESKKQSDEDLLRFYLKSQHNRDQYWEDIWVLIRKEPALRLLYHQEMGKIQSRNFKKRLREIGIEKGAFAILEGMIIAGGATKEEAQQMAKKIVPSEKRAWVHIFQMEK